MKITVNGNPHEVSDGNLAKALITLGYGDATVATAVNGQFVPGPARAAHTLNDGDSIEVLAPMQGG
ncbi:MAG: sulfur carrier protein ThiS [Alphaproteobacteria bacterium]|nr:sulfur carrier protein ThiS [Alphaproteobacteria bacterium SS10]